MLKCQCQQPNSKGSTWAPVLLKCICKDSGCYCKDVWVISRLPPQNVSNRMDLYSQLLWLPPWWKKEKTFHTRMIPCHFIPSKFSVFSHLCETAFGVDCSSLGDNFVTYLPGIQLTPGVCCHTGASAWNQKWLLEDGPTTEVSDYCHAHSV